MEADAEVEVKERVRAMLAVIATAIVRLMRKMVAIQLLSERSQGFPSS